MEPLFFFIREISFFDRHFGGNSVAQYLWFAGLTAAAFVLVRPVTFYLVKLISRIARRFTDGKYQRLFQSLVVRPLQGLFQTIMLYVAVNQLQKPFDFVLIHRNYKKEEINVRLIDIVDHIFVFFTIVFTTLILSRILDFIFRTQLEKARRLDHKDKVQILPLLKEMIKLLLLATSFFTMLGIVLHVNVPALITGLGIGGVAIALAGKETVENLFASFTILLDKPFRTYDTVKLGGIEGKVEKIGFRSTRLRNGDGSVYIIPNKKLVDENLENLTERELRRVKLPVVIKYGIGYDALQQLIAELRTMLVNTHNVISPVEIAVEGFGENAFQLMITYHLPYPLYDTSPDKVKQSINLRTFGIVGKYTAVVRTDATPAPPDAKPDFPGDEEGE